MGSFSSSQLHPKKIWKCDCCFEIYSCRVINKNGGFCPSCGGDIFNPVNDSIPLFVPDKAPDKKPVPKIKFVGAKE